MDDVISRFILDDTRPITTRTYKVLVLAGDAYTPHFYQDMQEADVVLREVANGFYEVVKARNGDQGEFIPPSIALMLFGIGKR
jgi:hypothetical protein